MEDNLNFFEKGRRPHFFGKIVRQPQNKIMQPKTIKSKNNCCGTAPGNLVLVYIRIFWGYIGIYRDLLAYIRIY
jgi:hypothetical protein